MLCIPPPQKSEQKSGIIKNNNSQQHKNAHCLRLHEVPRFPRFAQPGQSKLRIHQSFHKLIQFVNDLEIFDHAKLLTNGTLTMHKSSQTWILPKTNELIRTSQLPSRKFAAHSLHSILFSTIWINWMPAAAIQKANAETNSNHHRSLATAS